MRLIPNCAPGTSPRRRTPLVTGWATSIDESQMGEYQVDRVLTKPFEVDEVLRLVQELLAQGGRS